jgi:uncharacterized protein with von Willebrand factor type A (vWA) domain
METTPTMEALAQAMLHDQDDILHPVIAIYVHRVITEEGFDMPFCSLFVIPEDDAAYCREEGYAEQVTDDNLRDFVQHRASVYPKGTPLYWREADHAALMLAADLVNFRRAGRPEGEVEIPIGAPYGGEGGPMLLLKSTLAANLREYAQRLHQVRRTQRLALFEFEQAQKKATEA